MRMSQTTVNVRVMAALAAPALAALAASQLGFMQPPHNYEVVNLISDGFMPAEAVDPNLVNPWGIAPNPTGPWWVANNETGTATLYNGDGEINSLIVGVPDATEAPTGGHPTGIVFNGGSEFVVSDSANAAPARFIFASEDGTISGWAPEVPPPAPSDQAQLAVDNSASGAIYKGLALAVTPDGPRLYATDFHNDKIDVFDGEFMPVDASGEFMDSQIPDGFAPFGIATINGKIYVTYAMQDEEAEDDVAGAHLGYVDVFDTDGNLIKRLIKEGKLNAPWGLALAPDDFGKFSNRLLVGNFGDGRINAYNIQNGTFKGTLRSAPGQPIELDGLWGIGFGTGGDSGPTNVLFFAAGPGDEEHGLFGSISPTGN